MASETYAMTNNDKFPNSAALGNYYYRLAPGKRTDNDPSQAPEIFGLAPLLETVGVDPVGKIWLCPAASPKAIAYGNTYCFSSPKTTATSTAKDTIGDATSVVRRQAYGEFASSLPQWWIRDNVMYKPGVSGVRYAPASFSITGADRYELVPHPYKTPNTKVDNAIMADGSVRFASIYTVAGNPVLLLQTQKY